MDYLSAAPALEPAVRRPFQVLFVARSVSMARIAELLHRAFQLGPRFALEKGAALALQSLEHAKLRVQDYFSPTLSFSAKTPTLSRHLASAPLVARSQWPVLKSVVENYCNHRFDLLGSGWCRVVHGMQCQGVEGNRYHSGPQVVPDQAGHWLIGRINPTNLPNAQAIWSLIDEGYQPIDWHLDFKSGYRWSEKTWYAATKYGHAPGVDIKVPWELSRMQHLPQMALACHAARQFDKDESLACRLQQEFRNQILDFIATNPPRFGVNWRCAMDIGIRVANWLLAYDLFRAAGYAPDVAFESILAESVHAHARHILNNLEWHRTYRSNHYLANVTGLLFAAAYLPCSPEVDAWLAFAVQEFGAELLHQFTEDGTNFEASTSYHRLSTEMAVYGVALTLGLPPEKKAALNHYDVRWIKRRPRLSPAPMPLFALPTTSGRSPFCAEIFQRLQQSAEFTRDITKPSGAVQQVGDNDSGRFFKLQGVYHRLMMAEAKTRYRNLENFSELADSDLHWDEDQLDHRSLVAGIAALTGREDLCQWAGGDWPEATVIAEWAGNAGHASSDTHQRDIAAQVQVLGTSWETALTVANKQERSNRQSQTISIPHGATNNLTRLAYPHFGLYIWRSPRLYLAVRCGPVGQNGKGGHAHNDQLSLELQVDGEDWITDVGTYLYTASPEARNRYRSVAAHWAPQVNPPQEPARLDRALFQLSDTTQATCLHFSSRGFIGTHYGYGPPIIRIVEWTNPQTVKVTDLAPPSVLLSPIPAVDPRMQLSTAPLVSLGYGVVTSLRCCQLSTQHS